MDALTFLLANANAPFAIAGVFVGLLLLLELLGLLLAGAGVSSISGFINADGHDFDLGEIAGDALGYLHWGKVPLLVILASLTGLFALCGYGAQLVALSLVDGLLPAWVASIPAVAGAVVGTHYIAMPIARLMPSDNGDAPTERGMLGLVGEVVLGPVDNVLPGEVRVRDLGGREHFLQVKTADPSEVIPVGAEIVITGRAGSFYTVGQTSQALIGRQAASVVGRPSAAADVLTTDSRKGA